MKNLVHGRLRQAAFAAVLFWTVYWTIAGWEYLQLHSIVVQQGFGGDGVQLWEIFNIKMVAAHQAIRWAGGVVALGAVVWLLERPRARRAVRRAGSRVAAGQH